ncbi:sensor histidine kinase [Marinithermus hydrothermalis]|uniref:histidine kinase n=1 Tax=Marinithermus hydrothermalis (strain DSM 14884 / JCM 11576 / T1) TaxID=869210 RepID=F2NNH1_MARHT|nr:ATP-binding protein [Marinithermus hydrothermalis]AEB10781.1 integral membrane sensor signal transduction histidine kinase [Marinithermus hydrothermalis DSM 14884]
MRIAARLVLAFVLVAVFAAGLSSFILHRSFQARVNRFLEREVPRLALGAPPSPPPPLLRAQQRLLLELRAATWQATLIALAVALGTGGYLAWRFARPIEALTRATRRYAAGARAVRVRADGPGELAELARAFNALADRLAAEEAQTRRLVADIAHELRTPLTVLKSELEALADGLLSPDPETLERLVEEVDLLARLVGDLRLLSLAEAGGLELAREDVPLRDLVRRVAEGFAPRAAAKGVRLVVTAAPVTVHADPGRLRQVLLNLLDNALRHTPAGGCIAVGVHAEGAAVLEVADTGPGIPEAHRPHVFERFYRPDPARSRAFGGSGIGLAIVKALVEAHGGRVEAMNRPEGGAVFRVRLPISGSPPRPGGRT